MSHVHVKVEGGSHYLYPSLSRPWYVFAKPTIDCSTIEKLTIDCSTIEKLTIELLNILLKA